MIILSRKRITFILSCFLVGMITFVGKSQMGNKTLQTVALPVTNKVIVIDAGHGKPDERS